MVAITNALNLAHTGVYKDLQSIPPGGSWEESFWITTKGGLLIPHPVGHKRATDLFPSKSVKTA